LNCWRQLNRYWKGNVRKRNAYEADGIKRIIEAKGYEHFRSQLKASGLRVVDKVKHDVARYGVFPRLIFSSKTQCVSFSFYGQANMVARQKWDFHQFGFFRFFSPSSTRKLDGLRFCLSKASKPVLSRLCWVLFACENFLR
jgi:hypothetical protein